MGPDRRLGRARPPVGDGPGHGIRASVRGDRRGRPPCRPDDEISSAALAGQWGGPIYSGYVVLASSDPAQDEGVSLLPRPQIEGGEGLDLQNLFYALQWWIFGGFAVMLWLRLVRDEARGSAADPDEDPFGALARSAPSTGPTVGGHQA